MVSTWSDFYRVRKQRKLTFKIGWNHFVPSFISRPHISVFCLKTTIFFLCYQKQSVRFCPSKRLKMTWLETDPSFTEAYAFTGIQDRNVIVSKNLHFCTSTWVQQNGKCKTSTLKAFLKRCVFSGHFLLDTCGHWAKSRKDTLFLSKNGYVWTGPHVDLQQICTRENYM